MSDDEFEFDGNAENSEGFKNLRKAYENQAKELKALREAQTARERADRQANLTSIFKAKGINEKVASLYQGEDTSEDAVSKWAEEYGFATTTADKPGEDPNETSAARVTAASYGSPETPKLQLNETVLGDPAEIMRLLATQSTEELERLGLLKADPNKPRRVKR